MNVSVLEEKLSFKLLGLTFSYQLNWGSYIISVAKTASEKIRALIPSMKFLFLEVALYLYKSNIPPCMEYCSHICAGAASCYLKLLDKLQKQICRTVGPSIATSLETLAHNRNVASLSFLEVLLWQIIIWTGPIGSTSFFSRRFTWYSHRLHDHSVTIPRCSKYICVNSFFLHIARLWNSLPIEHFPLTYKLNDFKSRINRHQFTVGSF